MKRSKGILLNLLAATTGGQVTRAEAFLRRFRTYAPDIRLVIVKDRDSLPSINDADGWEVINVHIGVGRLRALRRAAWENWNLPQLMNSKDLNIYLTFSHYLPLFLGEEVYSIVGVSNLAPFSEEAWGVESNIVRFRMRLLRHTIISSCRRADQVIALSNTCKSILAECSIKPLKIKVIPNGVEIFNPSADDIQNSTLPCESPFILSVSHFYRYKNFERLIEAFSLLPAQRLNRLRLVIVGKPYDRKYFEEIEGLIERLGLTDHVSIIAGADRSSLDALYRNASLFVFTSLIENSPNILLEAMAYSLPIVASNVEPMPEFGSNGVRYFKAFSAEDLADKIEIMLSDPTGVADLRRRAKMRADEYSWENFTKSVIEVCVSSQKEGLQ
ncbi:glycosyltransferase family 1 protein [Polynucleobacter sp. MWH-HuK1]|uniref:glycosyltransferase family 4 protein n=1 Tax=Polynucleobacter sp. MWH-HuK1 TaxID=1743158 RepID=UPI001C0C4043|nr:glycosyltransferase family 1 protein [Polynucleobacter sp. MWH-HuK1]MBU3564460.1 glycosyltransferase family 4 protein [Polynucleobacter sp. MWH-HuK1]